MSETYIYSICGEITWNLVAAAIDEIYENYSEHQFNHLIALISSPGGDLDSAWGLYSSLKHLGCKITTVANGRVYSSAALIYLAGNERVVYDDSMFLFHPTAITITAEEEREGYKIEEDLKAFQMDDKLFQRVVKNTLTKAKPKDIKRLSSKYKNLFIDAQEALRLNLATKLVQNFNEI